MRNSSRYPNTIVLLVDTLREDYADTLWKTVRSYNFLRIDNVIAPSPWTLPTHVSMFTGLYPGYHKVHEGKSKLPKIFFDENYLLPLYSELQEIGYKTYLFSANTFISPAFGFRQFNEFYDLLGSSMPLSLYDIKELMEIRRKYPERNIIFSLFLERKFSLLANLLRDKAYKLLKIGPYVSKGGWPKDKGSTKFIELLNKIIGDKRLIQPFFIFVNLMEVHEPYVLNEYIHPADKLLGTAEASWIEKWRRVYPHQVEYVSNKVSEILKILNDNNLIDNSLIIITSDHGQLLGEHGGKLGHGTYLYDELLKVPFFVKFPENYDVKLLEYSSGKYFSLTYFKHFVLNAIKGDRVNNIFSEFVFAESYGIPHRVQGRNKKEEKLLKQLDSYRIAVYFGGEKAIFNVKAWKFEKTPDRFEQEIKHVLIKFLNNMVSSKFTI